MLKRYVFDLERTHMQPHIQKHAYVCYASTNTTSISGLAHSQSLCLLFSIFIGSFQTISTALHFIGFTFA